MASSAVPITGDTSRLVFNDESLAQFFSWKVNPKAETKSTRAYDDVQGWERSTEATLKMWDGSAEGNYVQAQYDELLALLGRKIDAQFITQRDEVDPDGAGAATATEYGYSGEIIITGLPITHAVGEIVTCSLEFKGTGPFAPYSGPYPS